MDELTSTSSPSPISFLISGGGGNLTSLKGTWRSGCQLKVEEALHINSIFFILKKLCFSTKSLVKSLYVIRSSHPLLES